jgi:arabinogalactan oligomer/maltooligosaccharide transport system substrate-binding protein
MTFRTKGLVALSAAALLLTACSSGSDTADNTPAASSAGPLSGSVVFWDTSNEAENKVFKELAAEFEKANPGVTVDVQLVPFAEAQNKYKTAAQAGNAPDVMRTEVAWVSEFASLGYLQDLSGTILSQGTDDFLATPMSSSMYDGKQYAVPQVTDAPALLYNKALLEKAGVEAPTTWDEVAAAAPKLKDAGVDALYGPFDSYFTQPYVFSYGGNTVDVDTKKILINDPESVAGFQESLDLIKAGAVVSPDPNNAYGIADTAFKEGKLAMTINGPWSVPGLVGSKAFEANLDNLGIAMTPAGPDGKVGTPVGGHNYTVYRGSKNLDAAYAFVQFMASTDSQVKITQDLGLLPTRNSAYENAEIQANPVVTAFKTVMDQSTPRAWIPEGGQFFTEWNTQWKNMVAGEVTAQEGADNIAKAWQVLLPDYTD